MSGKEILDMALYLAPAERVLLIDNLVNGCMLQRKNEDHPDETGSGSALKAVFPETATSKYRDAAKCHAAESDGLAGLFRMEIAFATKRILQFPKVWPKSLDSLIKSSACDGGNKIQSTAHTDAGEPVGGRQIKDADRGCSTQTGVYHLRSVEIQSGFRFQFCGGDGLTAKAVSNPESLGFDRSTVCGLN